MLVITSHKSHQSNNVIFQNIFFLNYENFKPNIIFKHDFHDPKKYFVWDSFLDEIVEIYKNNKVFLDSPYLTN